MRDNPYDDDPGIIEAEMWDDFVDRVNRPRTNLLDPVHPDWLVLGKSCATWVNAIVPAEACEEDHPDHAIFLAWRALQQAIDTRSYRLEAEEWAAAEAPAGCPECGAGAPPIGDEHAPYCAYGL